MKCKICFSVPVSLIFAALTVSAGALAGNPALAGEGGSAASLNRKELARIMSVPPAPARAARPQQNSAATVTCRGIGASLDDPWWEDATGTERRIQYCTPGADSPAIAATQSTGRVQDTGTSFYEGYQTSGANGPAVANIEGKIGN